MVDATPPEIRGEGKKVERYYSRFDLSQRLEHGALMLSFTILAVTGLAQLFVTHPAGEGLTRLLGGIEMTRLIHRGAAIILMAISIYHVMSVLYRVLVKRVSLSMAPLPEDFKHLWHDFLYYLGKRKHKAFYGRYSYAEKVEYYAVVWGTLIMAVTGFMMWNPLATARWLPGEFIPAAKAAHGGEALLAVLAIILWHFYHVHVRHFNKSMFSGKMSETEMRHEHPAELAQIKAEDVQGELMPVTLRRRQRIFFPAAFLISSLMGFGLFKFATFEQTAIATVPRGESVPVFVQITSTPTIAPLPTESPPAGEVRTTMTWDEGIGQMLGRACGTCHGALAMGSLSLLTYEHALSGGVSQPGWTSGDSEASLLVQVQLQGGHPGQLNDEELVILIEWIERGAPER
jgi:cytochrome b subunit of formate dehydrogenase